MLTLDNSQTQAAIKTAVEKATKEAVESINKLSTQSNDNQSQEPAENSGGTQSNSSQNAQLPAPKAEPAASSEPAAAPAPAAVVGTPAKSTPSPGGITEQALEGMSVEAIADNFDKVTPLLV